MVHHTEAIRNEPTPIVPNFSDLANYDPTPRSRITIHVTMDFPKVAHPLLAILQPVDPHSLRKKEIERERERLRERERDLRVYWSFIPLTE